MRRGGGGLSALKVTAVSNYASLPTAPKLYQMCVISSTAVTNVFLTNAAPDSPSAGDLQICTGYANTQPIYLDSNDRLAVYPTNANQYNGSAWIAVDLYTWNGTSWIPPWKYLIKSGVNNAAMGGSLTTLYGSIAYNTGSLLYTKSGTDLSGELRKSLAIDMTPFTKLKLNGYAYYSNPALMYIRNTIAGTVVASITISTTNSIYSLDVSAYNREMFLGLSLFNNAVLVADWWLE